MAGLLGRIAISAVNYAEVVSKVAEDGVPAHQIDFEIANLRLRVLPLTATIARAAGLLRPATRHLGLSLADRVATATAVEMQLPILTCDRAWSQLDLPVPVVLIR